MARIIIRISLDGPSATTRKEIDRWLKRELAFLGQFRQIGTSMYEGQMPLTQAGAMINELLIQISAAPPEVTLDHFFIHIDRGSDIID